MASCKMTLLCLPLILAAIVTTGRSAVLSTKFTEKQTTESSGIVEHIRYERKPCDSHDDCNCSFGVGLCFQGSCLCIRGMSNPRTMTEAEIANFLSRHSANTSGTTATVDRNSV